MKEIEHLFLILMPKIITTKNAQESWRMIFPIITISRDSEAKLIGTGFFITSTGVLITAKHVITENIDSCGGDINSIAAIQMLDNNKIVSRPLIYSSLHSDYDLAVCETTQFTDDDGNIIKNDVLALTLDVPQKGHPIATHAFHGTAANLDNENYDHLHAAEFHFSGYFQGNITKECVFSWKSRITKGYLTNYYPKGRDSHLLPFPCFESDTAIYGGTSGGPVFDAYGRVFAVNCSSFEGANIAYHTDIAGILDLPINNINLSQDDGDNSMTIKELAKLGCVAFDPKLKA